MPSGKEAMREWRRKNPKRNAEIAMRARLKKEEKRMRERIEGNPRMLKGREPGEGFIFVGSVEDCGVEWNVSTHKNGNWLNIKTWCNGECHTKANYMFGFNGERFSESKDRVAMREHRPDLLKKIESMFVD